MESSDRSTRAVIDLGAFRHNLDVVRKYAGSSAKIMAVVKANGYGHGMIEMARCAMEWGADFLGVARVHEGMELRQAGIQHPTLVFEASLPPVIDSALIHGLDLTVVNRTSAELIAVAAQRLHLQARVHVKVDTGMGRLGASDVDAEEVVREVARSSHLEFVGLYSHFATSEDPDQTFARQQLNRFFEICEHIRKDGIEMPLRHMANSGAIITMPDAVMDMVRPGIMLYGYPPGKDMKQPFSLRPVMSLISKIAFIKRVRAGTSISYGRRYFTKHETTIATVPMGYADGYSRLLTNRGEALVRGKRYPVVGTICMDQLMLDLGDDAEIVVSDDVLFMGAAERESISGWDIADLTGTIPYEVTCQIAPRVIRLYHR
jgi:alanine racemase